MEKEPSFCEEQLRSDEEVQNHQESPLLEELLQLYELQPQLQDLPCEQTPQSVEVKHVVYSELLPDKFTNCSLLSVEEKGETLWDDR